MMFRSGDFSDHCLARLILTAFILTATLCLPYSSGAAGPVLEIDADKQFNYAEHSFENGEFFRAIDEYSRFIYFFPKDERVILAFFRRAMAFYSSRRYIEARHSFAEVIDQFGGSEFAIKSYFMISECHLRLNQMGPAATTLHNLITLSDNNDVKDEAYYRLGWIYVETAAWDKSRMYFAQISSRNREKFKIHRLSAELDKTKAIARKDPGLAGILSIVPGGGYVYCERYQDALIAFLINGGLIWAAYESFDNDNIPLGVLLSLVGAGFYAGNIYGAVASAHKHNRKKTEYFIEKLKKNTRINLSAGLRTKTIQLSFQFTF